MSRTKRATSIDHHVARRLREVRKAAGFTQGYIAHKLGITFQQIQKYENGSNRLSAGRLFQISELVGVPIGYFFEGLAVTVTDPATLRAAVNRKPRRVGAR